MFKPDFNDTQIHPDNRGYLAKWWSQSQDQVPYSAYEMFITHSKTNVIRAIHFQHTHQTRKLITILNGDAFFVIVNLRESDPNFGKHLHFLGSGADKTSFIVPNYCGFGYQILHDADILYVLDQAWYPEGDTGIRYNDPEIAIPWPNPDKAILNEKDQNSMSFTEFKTTIRSL
jgi:dTDP-4-dehydrorhamnose 3,5-epimerase